MKSKLLEIFEIHSSFSRCMIDAYVLIDAEGNIKRCNQLFSQLVNKKIKQIMKAPSFDGLLNLSVDGVRYNAKKLLSLHDIFRLDEVNCLTANDKELNLILGFYHFFDADELQGMFIIIRDVTAETNLQGKYYVKSTLSVTDSLTGLFNRTHFDNVVPELVGRLKVEKRRSDNAVSIFMADLDYFKRINDDYGHQAGDYVLQKVAGIFKRSLRRSDLIFRYGGEEFLVVLVGSDLKNAKGVAENLRKAVASDEFTYEKRRIPVTVSIGLAQVNLDLESAVETISRADIALYEAKRNGRDRVQVSEGA